ncbi:MAG: flagellar basal body rod protein FlgC [Gammaproteobacteria bacterium]
MSLFHVMNVAGTALAAQSVRLNTVASNMANANSAASSLESTYRARHPVFMPAFDAAMEDDFDADFSLDGAPGVGVEIAGIVESQAPLRREYQPGHPLADADGYVFMPNVNVVEEMADMISASRSYQTNIEIMEASKQMLTRTLALGQQ